MRKAFFFPTLLALSATAESVAFLQTSAFATPSLQMPCLLMSPTQLQSSLRREAFSLNRQAFLFQPLFSLLALLPAATSASTPTLTASPSLTFSEFDLLLQSSAKAISIVELSGPKSETAIVTLIDGTSFSLSDLIESPTDPRSPLKLVARCRLYHVPVRNLGLLSALRTVNGDAAVGESGRKKKLYTNDRVRQAEVKEREKRRRMEEDERERLEELYRRQNDNIY